MLFRTTAARSIPRSLSTFGTASTRSALSNNAFRAPLNTLARPSRASRPLALALRKPLTTSLVRYRSSPAGITGGKEVEDAYAKEKVPSAVDIVSTESSIHPVTSEIGRDNDEHDVDMMAGIKSDFLTIKETFTLREVPREALFVGLAGVVPYFVTALSTVYLSWDIQHAASTGQGFLMSGDTAEQLLHIIEPIQLGYGATIISFLGAIHWGLEWAGFGGHQGYPRYAIGIVATAVAWPTLLLSAEVGLITQFLAFTFLYYADARASVRGWAPSWYATYRFVLTFIVGASIVASLIGRGQIADLVTKPTGAADRMRRLRETQQQQLEREEAEKQLAGADDEDEDEDE